MHHKLKSQDGIVLLHGIMRRASSMSVLERKLQAAGYNVLNLDYPSRHKSLTGLVDEIHPAIESFARSGEGRLHFVGHSMGGLLARAYVTKYRPNQMGSMVHLGTPNQGSEVADFLQNLKPYHWSFGPAGQDLVTRQPKALTKALGVIDYPLGVIAGTRSLNFISSAFILPHPNDGRVTVARTCANGMAAHLAVPATHTFMMRNPVVMNEVLTFLQTGRFSR